MARRLSNPFPSVRTEGGLLPAETLQRIAAGDPGLDGLTSAAYHLPPGERLNEAISRSWSRLVGAWASFTAAREKLPESDAGTTLTRERWLLPLFAELGYGRVPTTKPIPAGGKDYAVSHLWQKTPVHLVSFRADLDTKKPGASGASRSSPHSLLQELLNRSDDLLWGFVSNGLVLRLLRDNASLSRQAYVELDLAAMMDGELYSDFTLLWLLAHVSRVEAEKPEQCRLEAWTKAAREEGLRALDTLRDGVEKALEVLGRGFLEEPANRALLHRLASGALDVQDYYRQLLRLVYRLLFLLVAEDRGLLFHPSSTPLARERYLRYYGLSRLRALAAGRRGSRHGDLWAGLVLVMKKLAGHEGCPELALPALGSFLFSEGAMPDLASASLSNASLLEAVRKVALTERDRFLRPVDFRNLGAEELGSVYESLLELHPVLHAEGRGSFELRAAAGSERKTTGSYYTPTSLIECLLDSALDPVLDEAEKAADPEKALLALKVCDPACGSGHFLIAAAHRLARRLASVRTGEDEPDPSATRTALRDVIGRCLYGVDLNPMAAELCRVALWIESLEPGKPLSFLDHHVQVGNSLLGTTPALLASGIPDEAFTPIEGDEKPACSAWKKRNKAERQQMGLAEAAPEPWEAVRHLAAERAGLDATPDASPDGVRAKEERWQKLLASDDYTRSRLLADAWCAAFVWKKNSDPAAPPPVTEETFRRLAASPANVPEAVRHEIVCLREQYQFFHWHLAFPEVFRVPAKGEKAKSEQQGWSGGFDVVLGNPPWEQIEQDSTGVSVRTVAGTQTFVGASSRYPISSAGRKNLYALFLEVSLSFRQPAGAIGFVLPTGITQDSPASELLRLALRTSLLDFVIDFENRRKPPATGRWFPAVHPQYRFSLTVLRPDKPAGRFVFDADSPVEIEDSSRCFVLALEEIETLSDGEFKVPMFRLARDVEILRSALERGQTLGTIFDSTPPPLLSCLMFNFEGDPGLGKRRCGHQSGDDPGFLRCYEGAFVHQFDDRFGTSEGEAIRNPTPIEKSNSDFAIQTTDCFPIEAVHRRVGSLVPIMPNWLLVLRRQVRSTDALTSISAIVPLAAAEGSLTTLLSPTPNARLAGLVCASLNSFIVNFLVRLRLAGPNLNKGLVRQIPIPREVDAGPLPRQVLGGQDLTDWVCARVLELSYTHRQLAPYAADLNYSGAPFRWDEDRRFRLRCELDAAFFHLYGIPRADIDYIMDTFPIVRRNDEQKYGDYRTKNLILEIYDELRRAIDTGKSFVSRLGPLPMASRPEMGTPGDGCRSSIRPEPT